jgi:non-ribosomal peptide synthetase component F
MPSPLLAVPQGTAVPVSFTQGTCSRPSFSTITEAFFHHAATQPSAKAARDLSAEPPVEISYGELAQQSISLARRLQSLGVLPGDRVPLVVKRGVGMLVGIISILSCGAQYVPLDGGVVADETLRFVLKQTGGKVVLTSKSTAHRLSNTGVSNVVTIEESHEIDDKSDFIPFSQPEAGCYVIYTSGKNIHPYTLTCAILTSQEQPVRQKE